MSFLIRLSHALPANCLTGVVCSEAEKASTSVLAPNLHRFTGIQGLFGYMQFICTHEVTRITLMYDYDRRPAIAKSA